MTTTKWHFDKGSAEKDGLTKYQRYRRRHAEETNRKAAEYRKKHREKILARAREYDKIRDATPERKAYNEAYRKAKRPARVHNLRALYGLTVEAFETFKKSQGGKCAVCFTVPDKELHVDHCHETGRIRGLLCRECNIGIGQLKDNPELLREAASYLESEGLCA